MSDDLYYIKTIAQKEIEQGYRSKLMRVIIFGMPMFVVAMILVSIAQATHMTDAQATDLISNFRHPDQYIQQGAWTLQQVAVKLQLLEAINIFLYIPMVIPLFLGAMSIIVEKRTGTLEAVLATPASTRSILIGKTVATILPSVLMTILSFVVLTIGIDFITRNLFSFLMPDPSWTITAFLIAPLLSFISVYWQVLLSAYFQDQSTALVVSIILNPMTLFLGLTASGFLSINTFNMLVVTGFFIVAAAILLLLTDKMFNREEILTKWV